MKTLVILAGGKSTRMGKDKIFLHLHNNETFLGKLYREASGFFDKVVISAGSPEHAGQIKELLPEAAIIPDHYPEKGPMGGIVSVCEETGLEKFAVIPADVPGADMEVLSFFHDRAKDGAAVLRDGDSVEPLIAAYGSATLTRMKQLILKEDYRIRIAFSEDTSYFSFQDLAELIPGKRKEYLEKAFRNINTEQDYRDYIK